MTVPSSVLSAACCLTLQGKRVTEAGLHSFEGQPTKHGSLISESATKIVFHIFLLFDAVKI